MQYAHEFREAAQEQQDALAAAKLWLEAMDAVVNARCALEEARQRLEVAQGAEIAARGRCRSLSLPGEARVLVVGRRAVVVTPDEEVLDADVEGLG